MNCNHKKKIQIRFGDIDIMGHANNIVDASTGDIKTKTSQVMLAFSQKLGESISIPETLKIRIREFEDTVIG